MTLYMSKVNKTLNFQTLKTNHNRLRNYMPTQLYFKNKSEILNFLSLLDITQFVWLNANSLNTTHSFNISSPESALGLR